VKSLDYSLLVFLPVVTSDRFKLILVCT